MFVLALHPHSEQSTETESAIYIRAQVKWMEIMIYL